MEEIDFFLLESLLSLRGKLNLPLKSLFAVNTVAATVLSITTEEMGSSARVSLAINIFLMAVYPWKQNT